MKFVTIITTNANLRRLSMAYNLYSYNKVLIYFGIGFE
jgi:hypothetical protein